MTDPFSGWLFEKGIGENRAALIQNGELTRMRIERDYYGMRAGSVTDARFVRQWVVGRSGIVVLPNGQEALLQPLPGGLTEGQSLRVEIVRVSTKERHGTYKRSKARPVSPDTKPSDGPSLLQQIEHSEYPVTEIFAHNSDRLGAYGWHETMEQAESGQVPFDGGYLIIVSTPAMILIDVDGPLPPLELAKKAAKEIALVLPRLDITGNIGVDFPTLEAKADRNAVAQIFDDHMTENCERTAINGFGFMQIISRKTGPSVLEIVQANRARHIALQLLRQAERSVGSGRLQFTVHPAISGKLKVEWLDELARRTGRVVSVENVGNLPLDGGQIGSG